MRINLQRARRAGFIGVLAGLGAATGLASGILGSKSQKKAAKQQNELIAENNRRNEELFRQSRGSEGTAVLPDYFNQPWTQEELDRLPQDVLPVIASQYGVNPELAGADLKNQIIQQSSTGLEKTVARNISQNIMLQGSAADQLARLQPTQNLLRPAQDEAIRTVGSIFDGSLTRQELANLDPVLQTRLNAADAEAAAAENALQTQLNRVNASRQESGFGGDSLAKQMLQLNSRTSAAQSKSLSKSAARFQNALDRLMVQREGISRRLSNLNAPSQGIMAQNAFENAPARAVAENQSATMSPLQFFRISPQAFQQQGLNAVQGTMGQTLAGGLSAGLTGFAGVLGANEALNIERKRANIDQKNIWGKVIEPE